MSAIPQLNIKDSNLAQQLLEHLLGVAIEHYELSNVSYTCLCCISNAYIVQDSKEQSTTVGVKKIKNPYMAIALLDILLHYQPEVQAEILKQFSAVLSASVRSQHALHIIGKAP